MSKTIAEFCKYVDKSKSPFHAIEQTVKMLKSGGYTQILEKNEWKLVPGEKYFFSRNQSTVFAFQIGANYKAGNGANIIVSHSDSPCFKIKPVSNVAKEGYLQLGVQQYGGGIWHTWFDRDLTIAGRAVVREDGVLKHKLVDLDRPLLRIPSLAIHLDRTVNDSFKANLQTQCAPILGMGDKGEGNHHCALLKEIADILKVEASTIVDLEMYLSDVQPASTIGLNNEFVVCPRADNLASSYASTKALLEADLSAAADRVTIMAVFDNEEIGSASMMGGNSIMMESVLQRIFRQVANADQIDCAFRDTYCLSADLAHAIHPNYTEKHDADHKGPLGKGPVIKVSAPIKYATTVTTASIIKDIAKDVDVNLQQIVVRNDSPCGSTLGPVLAARAGLNILDIGIPLLSMHSIREMLCAKDLEDSVTLYKAFFEKCTLTSRVEIDEW
eukprot:TRINITY_DN10716_c0_g1_i1.p1 TRINITY_DN10716_c0_g1~~TRINITY_DN10716_c0_g1_i1.p1  ORF type:complete len:443 (-),score=131.68 TRINITY_DN10716_c0_g1_i1:191-1519(-)